MTRLIRLVCIIAALSSISVVPATAQTPDTGMVAVGADVGSLLPDGVFEPALTLGGFAEWYSSPRVSVRAMLAWASPGVESRTEDHFRQVKLLFNGVYNWEYGVWHPFVTAGTGFYFVRLLLNDRPDPDGETRGGINFGGGVEFFTTGMTTIKGEARWDLVSHPPGQPDATGFTITIGLKQYF